MHTQKVAIMPSDPERKELFKNGVSVLGGRFRLYVTSDGLKAYLKPEPGVKKILTLRDIQKLQAELRKVGITYGVLDPPEYSEEVIVVARGEKAINGQDGYIEFLVDMTPGPREKNNKIDFKELNSVVCVKARQAVARKVLPTKGKDGRNVFGEVIKALPGKEIQFKYGPGLRVSSDGTLLIAEESGVLVNKNGRLKILPSYRINGDIDWDIGNIHFCGKKLTLTGDVKQGFLVECWGDLEIRGRVENNTTIQVYNGDLVILGLIQGKDTKISCEGNTTINVAEYATFSVGGNLIVENYVLNCKCRVGGVLKALKGKIVGGEYHVRESIIAQTIGNYAHIRTIIKAGYDEFLQSRLEEINRQILLAKDIITKIEKTLNKALYLLKNKKLKREKIFLLFKIKEKYIEIKSYLNQIEDQKKQLEESLEELKTSFIQVINEIHPGVEVWIWNKKFEVDEILPPGSFYYKDGKVLFRPKTY